MNDTTNILTPASAETDMRCAVGLQRLVSEQLPGFDPTDAEWVQAGTLEQRTNRAIELIKAHEPADGYYLGYSGGKDSDTIKRLAQMAGVKFVAWYNQTTIDPPEVVRHIKAQPEVQWSFPEHGNMMTRVVRPESKTT